MNLEEEKKVISELTTKGLNQTDLAVTHVTLTQLTFPSSLLIAVKCLYIYSSCHNSHVSYTELYAEYRKACIGNGKSLLTKKVSKFHDAVIIPYKIPHPLEEMEISNRQKSSIIPLIIYI